MSSPMDSMLDEVKWEVLPPQDGGSDLPYVTHRGVLNLMGVDLEVFQLNTGQCVISEESMNRFFGGE